MTENGVEALGRDGERSSTRCAWNQLLVGAFSLRRAAPSAPTCRATSKNPAQRRVLFFLPQHCAAFATVLARKLEEIATRAGVPDAECTDLEATLALLPPVCRSR